MKATSSIALGLVLVTAACSRQGDRDQETTPDTSRNTVSGPHPIEEPRRAQTQLTTTAATELSGKARLSETEQGVRVVLEVENAKPGMQAVHVHERGDCSDIAGKSMGEHFAPDYKQHALPHTPERHLGDLGNIEVGPDGKGTLEIVAPRASLKPDDSHTFLGKALVVHESSDKGTGPSGDAGKPVACGVISVSDSE